jgi:hypothetical protein
MATRALCISVAVGLLLAQAAAARQVGVETEALPDPGPRLFAVTADDFTAGALVEVLGETRPTVAALAPTDGARQLRHFGDVLFVINRLAGTIARVPMDGGASQAYSLGIDAMPMDVLVPGPQLGGPGVVWVSRRNDPRLLLLDLDSGAGIDVIDLEPVGGGAAIALGTMERHGHRLFVQVRVSAGDEVPGVDSGVLAVVDLSSRALIDVDPLSPGIQGVDLQGAPPRFKMQIVDQVLFVSTTDSTNDARGGIEMVDLQTLTSVGYAASEADGFSDMGGFVMVDGQRGYYVFHTDFAISTHLVAFSIAGGTEPGGMIDLLGDEVDVLVHDPWRQRLYLPSGFAPGAPGLYAFSSATDELLGPPLPTGLRPHDALLMRPAPPAGPAR